MERITPEELEVLENAINELVERNPKKWLRIKEISDKACNYILHNEIGLGNWVEED